MQLTEKGLKLFQDWENVYYDELIRLRDEKNDHDYCEGWSIIDNDDFIRNIDDEIGLLVFGYDDHVIDTLKEWEELDGSKEFVFGYTYQEVIDKIINDGYISE